MHDELGRQLIHATDAAWESYQRNATASLDFTCRICGAPPSGQRADHYAVLYTSAGTIFYPICKACVETDTAKAMEAQERYLAARA